MKTRNSSLITHHSSLLTLITHRSSLLTLITSLFFTLSFSVTAFGQCFMGEVSAGNTEICAGSSVVLTCKLMGGQAGSNESNLSVTAWQQSTNPDNPGSWTTITDTGKTLNIPTLANTISYRAQTAYDQCTPQYTRYITITVSSPTIAGTLQGSAEVCASANNGNITVNGATGVVMQWYKRDNTDPDWIAFNNTGNTFRFQNLPLTTRYRVAVQNGSCPPAYTNEAEIQVHANPEALFTASRTCDGDMTRFTNQSKITTGFVKSHLWQFGDGSQSTQLNPVKQYYNADTYQVTLTVISDKNCSGTVAVPVTVHPNPISSFEVASNCVGTNTRFTNTSKVRSGEGMSYAWSFGDQQKNTLVSPEHLYASAGTYRAKMVATTANGLCRDSVERDFTVYELPVASAGKDTTISAGHSARLRGTGGVHYAWSPYQGLSSNLIANPVANPQEDTHYTLTVTDANGCVNTAGVNIFINHNFNIHPYNVITPDGNGENDVWIVDYIDRYPQARVRIINRWGEEIYTSQNYSDANAWDGYNKNGDILPEGTYYYIITLDGDSKVYKGAITLLRQ